MSRGDLLAEIGENVVVICPRREFAFKPAPYPSSTDFLRLLRAEAGPQHEQLISDLFEKITLYDMKASEAKAKLMAEGTGFSRQRSANADTRGCAPAGTAAL